MQFLNYISSHFSFMHPLHWVIAFFGLLAIWLPVATWRERREVFHIRETLPKAERVRLLFAKRQDELSKVHLVTREQMLMAESNDGNKSDILHIVKSSMSREKAIANRYNKLIEEALKD